LIEIDDLSLKRWKPGSSDTWSAQEESRGEGLHFSTLAKVCFGGSTTLASEAINSSFEKGFVSTAKSSRIVSLTDLGMLAMEISQLGVVAYGSVKESHAQ